MRSESAERRPPAMRGQGPESDAEGKGEARCCLTLNTLGDADLAGAGGETFTAVLSQPKRFALLVYLSLAWPRSFHRRDSLLMLFWPELDDQRARNALSQSLSFLRAHLPDGVIITRGAEEVGVDHERVRTGVGTFEGALEEGRWADALKAYHGEFLHGFHLSRAKGFEEWMEVERARLRKAAAGAAWSLAGEQVERGALLEAHRTALQALDLVATDECRVRGFIGALAEAGDRAASVAFYESFCARLRRELELEPSDDTRVLVEAIRSGAVKGRNSPIPAPGIQDPEEEGAEGSLPLPATSSPEVPAGAEPQDTGLRRKGPSLWLFPAGGIVVLASLFVLPGRRPPEPVGPPPPDRPFTVLAEVQGSADAGEREAVGFLLRTALDVSHVVQTVPEPDVARTLVLMDQAEEAPPDAAAARVVGARLGVPTVVIPRLDRLGDTYSLAVRVEDADSGHLRVALQGRAPDATGVVGLLDSLVLELRGELGEAREILAQSQPLPQVLTPSLEALLKYRAARNRNGSGRAQEAVSLLWEAVALDTAFAMAWHLMAAVYGNYLNQPDSAAFATERFQRFPERINAARRADLELHRHMLEDVALWDVGLEEAERAVIRDPDYLNNYAVYTAYEAGRPDSAVNMMFLQLKQVAETVRRFDPSRSITTSCWINTHYWATGADRLDDLFTLLDSIRTDLAPDCAREIALFESLAAGEWEKAEDLLRSGEGGWRWPPAVEAVSRQLAPLRGRIRLAHGMPDPENAEKGAWSRGQWASIGRLLLEVAYGVPPSAPSEAVRGGAGATMELEARGREEVEAYVVYGVRQALVGDTLEAMRVSRRLRALRDTATSRTFEGAFAPWFALMEVGPAFRRQDWVAVIHGLEPVAAGIRKPGVGFMAGDAYLVWWLLATAHQGLGQPEAATGYLESILQRPSHGVQDWSLQGFIHPAARFKLAGLYAEAGDAQDAREQYRQFLDIFTDPEPEFRWMVGEARRGMDVPGGSEG